MLPQTFVVCPPLSVEVHVPGVLRLDLNGQTKVVVFKDLEDEGEYLIDDPNPTLQQLASHGITKVRDYLLEPNPRVQRATEIFDARFGLWRYLKRATATREEEAELAENQLYRLDPKAIVRLVDMGWLDFEADVPQRYREQVQKYKELSDRGLTHPYRPMRGPPFSPAEINEFLFEAKGKQFFGARKMYQEQIWPWSHAGTSLGGGFLEEEASIGTKRKCVRNDYEGFFVRKRPQNPTGRA